MLTPCLYWVHAEESLTCIQTFAPKKCVAYIFCSWQSCFLRPRCIDMGRHPYKWGSDQNHRGESTGTESLDTEVSNLKPGNAIDFSFASSGKTYTGTERLSRWLPWSSLGTMKHNCLQRLQWRPGQSSWLSFHFSVSLKMTFRDSDVLHSPTHLKVKWHERCILWWFWNNLVNLSVISLSSVNAADVVITRSCPEPYGPLEWTAF